uniref:Uncharacterized protein n=1 Tax=Anguilla anguilla TaxID=7936 RepID=A0A0E9WMJ1_ANGAN
MSTWAAKDWEDIYPLEHFVLEHGCSNMCSNAQLWFKRFE